MIAAMQQRRARGPRGLEWPASLAYTSKSDRGNTLNWPFASLAICVSTELSSSFQSDTVWIWSPLFPATASLATSTSPSSSSNAFPVTSTIAPGRSSTARFNAVGRVASRRHTDPRTVP